MREMMPDPRWSALTMDAVGAAAAAGAITVLPVGATEQHGSHLATGTDTLLAEAVSLAAASRTGDLVLPALAYGCSLGHTSHWPGTISLMPTTMTAVVVEIGRWAHASGFRKLVVVNGHATNGPPCQSALMQMRHELPDLRPRFVSLFDLTPEIAARYTEDAPDFHANEAETSMLLHLEPRQVELKRAVDEPDRTVGRTLLYPMPAVTSSGVVGRPSGATAQRGQELFEQLVSALEQLLKAAKHEQDPTL
jgi:creatinine amidohydrolase